MNAYTGPVPTIQHLKTMGLSGARVGCTKCHRTAYFTWEKIDLPDETEFPKSATLKRFKCSGCGADQVTVMPDWSAYRAPGGGKALLRSV